MHSSQGNKSSFLFSNHCVVVLVICLVFLFCWNTKLHRIFKALTDARMCSCLYMSFYNSWFYSFFVWLGEVVLCHVMQNMQIPFCICHFYAWQSFIQWKIHSSRLDDAVMGLVLMIDIRMHKTYDKNKNFRHMLT